MINLNEYGSDLQGDSPLGYTWHRHQGQRIFAVIDDWFDLPEWASSEYDDCPSAHAYGLTTLRDRVSEIATTRAISFFKLPDPGSSDFKGEIQHLINVICKWLSSVADNQCQAYILVDYFYGEGVKKVHMSGVPFVEYWKSQENRIRQELSLSIKMAHISISGAQSGSVVSNPYNLDIFSKVEIESSKSLSPKLKTWLDIDDHPLERLWRGSEYWFLAGRDDDDIMKHTTGNIQEYLDTPEDGRLTAYRHNIESAMGLSMPDSWWHRVESISAIHESLKCLCGSLFCGQCNADTAKRPITTGAAFLIALMAHQKQCGDIKALTQSDYIWNKADRAATSFIFPKQDCQIAKESAIALYDCFRLLFEVRDRNQNNGIYENSQVKKLMFSDRGRFLRIELSWNSHQKTTNCAGSLSERMTNIFQGDVIKIPASPPKNTREAMLRLWSLMAVKVSSSRAGGFAYGGRSKRPSSIYHSSLSRN